MKLLLNRIFSSLIKRIFLLRFTRYFSKLEPNDVSDKFKTIKFKFSFLFSASIVSIIIPSSRGELNVKFPLSFLNVKILKFLNFDVFSKLKDINASSVKVRPSNEDKNSVFRKNIKIIGTIKENI